MHRKILIAEDHALLRRSIKAICNSEHIGNLDEVETCQALLKALKKGNYTHLILDLTLGDGNSLALLDGIFQQYSSLKVLIYSSQPSRLYGEKLNLRYGIRYISKAENEPETVQQLLSFLNGSPTSSDTPSGQRSTDQGPMPFAELGFREKQVLQYLLRGWSPRKIAEKLNISSTTVRVQKMSILKKTNTQNLLELKELANLYNL